MVRHRLAKLLVGWLGVSATAMALNDPTRPTDPSAYFGSGKGGVDAEWSLQSILTASDRRVAIINGTRVREGDRVGSAQVIRIQASQVLLKTGEGALTLRLLPTNSRIRP